VGTMPLIFVATSDLAGKARGKAFPAAQLEERLRRGVGWTPTNVMINCFDGIGDGPFGSLGDLLLIPDQATEVEVDREAGLSEHFMLGNIMTLEGTPWELCTRSLLQAALNRLHSVAGVRLVAAFEHEFQLAGEPTVGYQGFGREAFEIQRRFCERLIGALAQAGIRPDSIMKEYGPNQFEVVVEPDIGVRAADTAVVLRELTRSVARASGEKATFVPIRDVKSVGNGVHIHMSFLDDADQPVTYEESGPCGMSELTGAFAAGVLKYLDRLVALTAPSVISYERLTPHRWSAAFNNLGYRDREASLRICPVTSRVPAEIARQFNIEYRAADAAASPHLALAAIVHAGVQGIEEGLEAPQPTEEDLSLLSPAQLSKRGLLRLPQSLSDALALFNSCEISASWFPAPFKEVYFAHKSSEVAHVADMTIEDKCALYERTY